MTESLKLLTAYNTAAKRWPGAIRAALAIIIPGAVAILLGYDHALPFLAMGAFTVIYGEGHPYRSRAKVMAVASALLVAASVGGVVLSGNLLVAGIYTVLLATVGTFVQNALRLPLPGCFFIVMVGGGASMAHVSVPEIVVFSFAGCAFSFLIGMSPMLADATGPERAAVVAAEKASGDLQQSRSAIFAAWMALSDAGIVRGGRIIKESGRPLVERLQAVHVDIIPHTRPTARYRLYRNTTAHSHAVVTAEKVFIAGLATVLVGLALGFHRPDWGAVSALLLLQWGPEHLVGTVRAAQRVIGSLAGVAIYALMDSAHGWWLLGALALCQFCAEIFVAKNYALCVMFSTPLALLMGATEGAISSRIAEIAISCCFALLVLWLWMPKAPVVNHYRLQRRCLEAATTLLGLIHFSAPSAELAARRDLQYELLSEGRSFKTLSADYPDSLELFSERHDQLQEFGYALLGLCASDEITEDALADMRGRLITMNTR